MVLGTKERYKPKHLIGTHGTTHQSMITGRAALGGKGNRNAAIAVAGTNYAAPHSEANQMGSYFFSGLGVNAQRNGMEPVGQK